MTFLLDTNIISETSKPQPDKNVVNWLGSNLGQCVLSSVTLAEMRYGIERLPNGKRKSSLERKLQFLVEDYAEMLYEFDGAAAYEWGRYAAELDDCHCNTGHFPFCPIVNPFESVKVA